MFGMVWTLLIIVPIMIFYQEQGRPNAPTTLEADRCPICMVIAFAIFIVTVLAGWLHRV